MKELGKFDDSWLAEFRKISRITDEIALGNLRDELRTIGKHYRQIIGTTPTDLVGSPFNKTLSQRENWLQANVVRPTEKLLGALADDQLAWFSTWPYKHEFKAFPDRELLLANLQDILEFSTRLHRNLAGERDGDAATNHELRFYIFKDIWAAVRKNLPELMPNQGVFQKLGDEKTKRFVGPFPDAIRHIYPEITGLNEQLVRLIRMTVEDPNWDQ